MAHEELTNEGLERLANGNNQLPIKQPSIEAVDQLADELVNEYSNPDWRKWYCGVINQFGLEQVNEWRSKSESGTAPARLFSYYAREARNSGKSNKTIHVEKIKTIDEVFEPSLEELTSEAILKNINKYFDGAEIDKVL